MARPGRPERNRAARSFRQLRRFHHDINSNKVFGTHTSGADIFYDVTTPKFAIQAIRRAAELGWKPAHIITSVAESVSTVLQPAGIDNAEGLLSAGYIWEAD